MHGAVGREYMLAICTDLKNAGAQQEHILMFAKLLYKATFDAARTLQEWYRISASMTWTCDKMREKVPEYLNPQQCAQCQARKDLYNKKDICMSDARGADKCSACPHHPSNSSHKNDNILTGELNMIEQKPVLSFGQARKSFVHRMRGIESINGQFVIIEDISSNKPFRTGTKISPKTSAPYNVYYIRVNSSDIEGDLELMNTEIVKISMVLPADLPNYKGFTLAFDGQKWTAYPPQPVSTTTQTPTQTTTHAPEPPNQIDAFARRLQATVQMSDVTGKGLTGKDMIAYADMISPGNALPLINHAKTQGYILEKEGIYRAV